MKHTCDVCGRCYTRSHDLKRHKQSRHNQVQMQTQRNDEKKQWGGTTRLPCESHQRYEGFIFKHPFTMTIAAPTGGGKTWFVKKLLENWFRWIHPSPERIIWLYGQWQPMYEDMKRTIPGIEFVQGIPSNIGEDNFLDPRVRNLIVIDDLMSEAIKDSKICDLFTKAAITEL